MAYLMVKNGLQFADGQRGGMVASLTIHGSTDKRDI